MMITQRILEKKLHRRRIGMFVANVTSGNNIIFGYSLCSKEDRFDKELAMKIAVGRLALEDAHMQIPRSVWGDFLHFYNRAGLYFKGGILPPITED
jgi:hypothetical protein